MNVWPAPGITSDPSKVPGERTKKPELTNRLEDENDPSGYFQLLAAGWSCSKIPKKRLSDTWKYYHATLKKKTKKMVEESLLHGLDELLCIVWVLHTCYTHRSLVFFPPLHLRRNKALVLPGSTPPSTCHTSKTQRRVAVIPDEGLGLRLPHCQTRCR